MTQSAKYGLALLLFGLIYSSSVAAQSGTERAEVAQPPSGSLRSVLSLDKGWMLHRMPGFDLWPPEAVVTPDQIKMLQCPAPDKGWTSVQLPDDYVVRGDFSLEANAPLLAGGGRCDPGGRECGASIPPSASHPAAGKPGALNRPGRSA